MRKPVNPGSNPGGPNRKFKNLSENFLMISRIKLKDIFKKILMFVEENELELALLFLSFLLAYGVGLIFSFSALLEIAKGNSNTLVALIIPSFTFPTLLHSLSRDEIFNEKIRKKFFSLISFSIYSGIFMGFGLILIPLSSLTTISITLGSIINLSVFLTFFGVTIFFICCYFYRWSNNTCTFFK